MPRVQWADTYAESDDDDLFGALVATIRTRVPGFKIRYKNKSVWQRMIGAVLFFIRGSAYMKMITTTFGETTWFPSEKFIKSDKWTAFKILAHEYVHLLDRGKHPALFELLYIIPQVFALFSLIAIAAYFFGLWWLFGLVALVFLTPIPAPGRAALEKRGYAMGLMINVLRHSEVRKEKRDELHAIFEGPTYYWMWPFKKDIDEWIDETVRLTRNIDRVKPDATIFEESVAYQDVYELLTGITFEH